MDRRWDMAEQPGAHADGTVFVVDDDPAMRRMLGETLTAAGLRVEAYESAGAFLSVWFSARPGCLVLDIAMPGMDGLELQERLVEGGDAPPLVFLTGVGDVPMCVRAMKAGAWDFLEKPVDPQQLIEVVRGALAADAQRRSERRERAELRRRAAQLTRRQRQTARLLAAGHPLKSVARRLGVTIQTAAKHRAAVLEKLDVETETELARLAALHSLGFD